jgi:DNA (cytosine-5)-methyltransferase 1
MSPEFSFLEFFAGGGMTRLGLGEMWRCRLANDIDSQKCAAYRANFGGDDLIEGDIADITLELLPKTASDLMWGSFPCQDLSLAGARGGIGAKRSGAFFGFWRIAENLAAAGRRPRIVALENVTGLLTSNGGRDFAAIAELMSTAGYKISAMVLDAKTFTPQSRPRLFIFGFSADAEPPFAPSPPENGCAPASLRDAVSRLSPDARQNWRWLTAAPTARSNIRLADIIDWDAANWHRLKQTKSLLDMMSQPQRDRIDAIRRHGARRVGAAFRRTRIEDGKTVQRVEARFDGLAGCLRTPAGGSSRQILFAIENGKVRSRLINPREAARLMGLPEDYVLPERQNAALKLCGDGVCTPVVQWLAENIFEPALKQRARQAA